MAAGAQGQTLLERVTAYARQYESRVPNFVCTRVTRRSEQTSRGDWKLLDTVEDEVTFSGGRERVRTLGVNGKPLKPGQRVTGFTSRGEFGNFLTSVFLPESRAEFEEEGPERLKFRILQKDSTYNVQAGSQGGEMVGYHGELTARADGTVVRVHIDADNPRRLPFSDLSNDVEFGEVAIGEGRYFLPVRAEARIRQKKSLMRREMEFRNYHKYDADSSVNFSIPK